MEGLETLFYSSMGTKPEWPGLICVNAPEGYYNIGHKNLLAYKWALDNREWDFMARINASCYVSKKLLVDHVQKQPERELFQGCTAPLVGGGLFLWGGGQYLISRDVVQAMVNKPQLWNHALMEDVAMSEMVQKMGYTLDNDCASCSINRTPNDWLTIAYSNRSQGGFNFNEFSEFKEQNRCHFIRVKQDGDREGDIRIMRELHKNGV